MIGRRQAMTLLSGAALTPAMLRHSWGNEPSHGGREGSDGGRGEQLLYDLPLVLRTRQLAITTIFVLGMTQLWMLRTALGVDQRNENRLGLSAIPLLGSLVQRTYGAGDFTANNRIGAAYAEGAAMFVFLFPELMLDPRVRQMVFLNTLYSYLLRGDFQTASWAMMLAAMPNLCAINTVRRVVEARLSKTSAPTASAGASGSLTPEQMDTMVVGGLVSEDTSAGSKPLLQDVPALGTLFGGHVHKAEDNQLLVLLRPSTAVGDSERG